MKKKLATFLLCTSITTTALADWHFENFGGPFTLAHGVTYTPYECTGHENTIDITGNPTDPFTYYHCNGSTMVVTIVPCGGNRIFDPFQAMCTSNMSLAYLLYPTFPWDTYTP